MSEKRGGGLSRGFEKLQKLGTNNGSQSGSTALTPTGKTQNQCITRIERAKPTALKTTWEVINVHYKNGLMETNFKWIPVVNLKIYVKNTKSSEIAIYPMHCVPEVHKLTF